MDFRKSLIRTAFLTVAALCWSTVDARSAVFEILDKVKANGGIEISTAANGMPVLFASSMTNKGNLGIGTNAPAQRLHVVGSATFMGGNIGVGTTSPLSALHVVDGDIRFSTASGSPHGIIFKDGTTLNTAPSFEAFAKGGGLIYPNTLTERVVIGRNDIGSGMFLVSTNTTATPALYVESGNALVGLGSTNPSERLDISGGLVMRGMAAPSPSLSGQGKIYFDSSTNKFKISQDNSGFSDLLGGTGGAVLLQGSTPGQPDPGNINITGTGLFSKVGINTTGAQHEVDIRAGALAVSSFSTPGMSLFVSSGGFVGIGTNVASTTLHVRGDVYFGGPPVHDLSAASDLLIDGNLMVDGKILQHGGVETSFETIGIATVATGEQLFNVSEGTFTVLKTGNVGIGINAPETALHIKSPEVQRSSIWLDRDSASSHQSEIQFRQQGALRYSMGSDLNDDGTEDFYIRDDVAGSTRIYIASDGDVGFGTVSPTPGATVEFTGTGSVYFNTSGGFGVGTVGPTAAVEILEITSQADFIVNTATFVITNGNVGIGTANPGAALDIGSRTDGMIIPVGTTGQRPAVPVAGTMRYNTTTLTPEYYNGSEWVSMPKFDATKSIATGGEITEVGGYRIHTFKMSGTFTVSQTLTAEVLVVGGGGSGGQYSTTNANGGGGAGGVVHAVNQVLTPAGYPVTVGRGGAGHYEQQNLRGLNGQDSVFGSLPAAKGGGGGGNTGIGAGLTGGSGGGSHNGAGAGASNQAGGGGNITVYGNAGGTPGQSWTGSGGGGAGGAGIRGNICSNCAPSGNGGAGIVISITGSPVCYAGGGGGGANSSERGGMGMCGGGRGFGTTDAWNYMQYPFAIDPTTGSHGYVDALPNTGSGGGAGSYWSDNSRMWWGGAGGSGIVIVRYPIPG